MKRFWERVRNLIDRCTGTEQIERQLERNTVGCGVVVDTPFPPFPCRSDGEPWTSSKPMMETCRRKPGNVWFVDFDAYQASTRETAHFPGCMPALIYAALGMCGEAGECSEKIKKIYRDKGGDISREDKDLIVLELGDVLYYMASIAYELGVPFHEVPARNQEKLRDRKRRNVIHGEGDER